MNLDQVRDALVQEGRELLRLVEDTLLQVENSGRTNERVNAIFRAVHTIKGSAGLFGLKELVTFTHVMEGLLDQVRNKECEFSGDTVALLLSCCDYIGCLLQAVEERDEAVDPIPELRGHLLEQLAFHRRRIETEDAAQKCGETPESSKGKGDEFWHIYVRVRAGGQNFAVESVSITNKLAKLGRVIYVQILKEMVMNGDRVEEAADYLGFEVAFESTASKQEIEAVFEFNSDENQPLIVLSASAMDACIKLIDNLPELPGKLGEILVQSGALTPRELKYVLAMQKAAPHPMPPLGTLLVEERRVMSPMVFAALHKQQQMKNRHKQGQMFISVEENTLDHLIELIYELAEAGANLKKAMINGCIALLNQANEDVVFLAEKITTATMHLQVATVGDVFKCFSKTIADLGREYGKDIRLLVSGASTKLDRSLVDKLTDVLMHIVLNAIDHGIELPIERLAVGKPAAGSLRLSAYHKSNDIVIEVSDDGRGLDRECIIERATEKGLIRPGQTLSEREVASLIFQPGISTATHVSNISGRGVGMDAVRCIVEQLNGNVEMFSVAGLGSTVRLVLPLTTAILQENPHRSRGGLNIYSKY